MSVVNGIRAIAVYDPATGTAVQISKVVANTFDFSKAPLDLERGPMGNILDQADASAIRFQFLDDGTATEQLFTWRAARTRVSLVAVGHSVCIQWYETDHFVVHRNNASGMAQGRGDRYVFEMVREGHGKHAIYQQSNLLGHVAGLGGGAWKYSGSSGIADGYSHQGGGTPTWFAPSTQNLEHNTAGASIYTDVVFPIQLDGFNFKLTSDIVNLHSDTTTGKLQIDGRNYAGTNVLSDSTTVTVVGRDSASIAAASGTALYSIRAHVLMTPVGISGNDIMGAQDPVLRVDGATNFVSN